MSGSNPRRRPRSHDKSDLPVTFLPQGNPHARRAYLCAVLGLIPGCGLLLGLPAIVFGRLGYRAGKADPASRGVGHAFVSMLLGGLEILVNSLALWLIGLHLEWW
jgi:hypothetical protein